MKYHIINKLKADLREKSYNFFDGDLPYNVNVIGVRYNEKDVKNAFNDELYLVYRDKDLRWVVESYPITTYAGRYYFNNPANAKGTAILKAGQYRGVYKIDKHKGKYDALCQRLGPVTVYRDNDKDNEVDLVAPDEGWFGINIHKAASKTEKVDYWSAGCQVFKYANDFNKFMRTIKKSAELFGNKFTYTLLEYNSVV